MFSNLTQFGVVRSARQALGFYISYFLLLSLLSLVVGIIVGMLNPDNPEQAGFIGGNISAVVLCFILAVVIASKKKLFSSFKTLFLVVITALAALFLGTIGGLIPVSYLTTESNRKAETP